MHGGAFLTAFKAMTVATVLLFASCIVRADDTLVHNNGGGSPGDPQCGSTTIAVGDAAFQYNCNATTATGTITTFSFEVADSNTIGGGLTCDSNLTEIGWTGPSGPVHNPGGIDVCTFTAPTTVSTETLNFLKSIGDPYKGHSDGDCDPDDFVLGIVVNCGIHNNNGTPTSFSPFEPGSTAGFAVNGESLPSLLPEPSSISLLLLGLGGLPLVRRKFAR
jgi:hypothetical protein